MPLKKFFPALLLFAFLFAAHAETRADPVVITGGSFSMSNSLFNPFGANLQGENFRANVSTSGDSHQTVLTNCPHPCLAPATFNVTTITNLFSFSPARGSMVLDRQAHSGWFIGSRLTFVTDNITVPEGTTQPITLTTHFTMTGQLCFTAFNFQTLESTPIFNSEVIGSGTAFIEVVVLHFGRLEVRNVRFDFEPVPEPATLVLLGTGLAGAAAMRRRRRRRNSSSDAST